jgi:hypothetical protein
MENKELIDSIKESNKLLRLIVILEIGGLIINAIATTALMILISE